MAEGSFAGSPAGEKQWELFASYTYTGSAASSGGVAGSSSQTYDFTPMSLYKKYRQLRFEIDYQDSGYMTSSSDILGVFQVSTSNPNDPYTTSTTRHVKIEGLLLLDPYSNSTNCTWDSLPVSLLLADGTHKAFTNTCGVTGGGYSSSGHITANATIKIYGLK
jgi:hypothetical protein